MKMTADVVKSYLLAKAKYEYNKDLNPDIIDELLKDEVCVDGEFKSIDYQLLMAKLLRLDFNSKNKEAW